MTNCVLLNEKDNVVTTIAPVGKGDFIIVEGETTFRIEAEETIPLYHKASISVIPKGSLVYKYGQPIGVAITEIAAGCHVHTQNLVSESDFREER